MSKDTCQATRSGTGRQALKHGYLDCGSKRIPMSRTVQQRIVPDSPVQFSKQYSGTLQDGEKKDLKNTAPSPTVSKPSKGRTPLAKAGIGSGVSTAEKRKLVGLKRKRNTYSTVKRHRHRESRGEKSWLQSWFVRFMVPIAFIPLFNIHSPLPKK